MSRRFAIRTWSTRQPGLFVALALYLLLALSYFFIVPIFEGPDEWTHTGHVKYIAEGNGLPVMLPGQGIWGGQQPPLYYSLGALIVQPFELNAFEGYAERTRNPHASLGYALDPGNKNNYLHHPRENFPYRGLSLTVHVLRLYSMMFGLVALVFTYLTAYEIFDNPATIYSGGRSKRRDSSHVTAAKNENCPPLSPPRWGGSFDPSPQRGEVGRGANALFLEEYGEYDEAGASNAATATSPCHSERSEESPATPPRQARQPGDSSSLTLLGMTWPGRLTSFPGHPRQFFATLVALFVAGQPMFDFITASVANEPANIAFCAIVIWLAQRYVIHGPSQRRRRAVALGLALGLVSLSKMTGLAVGLVAVVAMLQAAVATRNRPGAARLLWRDGLIIGALFLAVGGWWYWRNYRLYGDFFQSGLYKLYFDVDPQPLTLDEFLYTLSTGEVSFWATFGWLNIVAPDWVYGVYWLVSRLGLLGVLLMAIVQLGRRRRPLILSRLLIHLVFPAALAFSLTRLVAIEGGIQGRQLLPALGSAAIVIVWGWWLLLPARLRRVGFALLLALLLGLALWLPYGVAAPEYFPPRPLSEADLPASLPRLDWTYNDQMKLLGAEIQADVVRPGERVPVRLYWQALQPMETNYSVFVHLIGRDYQNVGQYNSYPGLGLWPTRYLQPGQIVADTYPVLVNGGSPAPSRLLVNVGLFDFREPGRPGIPAIGPGGEPVPATIGRLKLVPHQWPEPHTDEPVAAFGEAIQLADYSLTDCSRRDAPCELTFWWTALGNPAADYTVFVHLWQADRQVAGFDAPPLNNDYPTHLWTAGEVIIDPHPLDLAALPAGQYRLLAGLYDLASGSRLPALVDGQRLPNDALELGTIEIEAEEREN